MLVHEFISVYVDNIIPAPNLPVLPFWRRAEKKQVCVAIGAYSSNLYILRWDSRFHNLPLVGFPKVEISLAIGRLVADIAICTAKRILNL